MSRLQPAHFRIPAGYTLDGGVKLKTPLSTTLFDAASVDVEPDGRTLAAQRKHAEAEAAYREALELRRRIHGPDTRYTPELLTDIGGTLTAQGKHAEAQRTYAKVPAHAPEYPEALYREAMLSDQRKNSAESRKLLEQLRSLPEKKNEFRVAALIKLSEFYEGENAPAAKLKALYQDLAASSADPEVVKQARLRLQELK